MIVGRLIAAPRHEVYLLAIHLTDIYRITVIDKFDIDGILQDFFQICLPFVPAQVVSYAKVFKIVFLLKVLLDPTVKLFKVRNVSIVWILHIYIQHMPVIAFQIGGKAFQNTAFARSAVTGLHDHFPFAQQTKDTVCI